jgi:hypothetical protein
LRRRARRPRSLGWTTSASAMVKITSMPSVRYVRVYWRVTGSWPPGANFPNFPRPSTDCQALRRSSTAVAGGAQGWDDVLDARGHGAAFREAQRQCRRVWPLGGAQEQTCRGTNVLLPTLHRALLMTSLDGGAPGSAPAQSSAKRSGAAPRSAAKRSERLEQACGGYAAQAQGSAALLSTSSRAVIFVVEVHLWCRWTSCTTHVAWCRYYAPSAASGRCSDGCEVAARRRRSAPPGVASARSRGVRVEARAYKRARLQFSATNQNIQ